MASSAGAAARPERVTPQEDRQGTHGAVEGGRTGLLLRHEPHRARTPRTHGR
jgi:hypothetical protein